MKNHPTVLYTSEKLYQFIFRSPDRQPAYYIKGINFIFANFTFGDFAGINFLEFANSAYLAGIIFREFTDLEHLKYEF